MSEKEQETNDSTVEVVDAEQPGQEEEQENQAAESGEECEEEIEETGKKKPSAKDAVKPKCKIVR